MSICIVFLKILFIYLERGEGREKDGERNIDARQKLPGPPLLGSPTRDWTSNPGMYPNWESNLWTEKFTGQCSNKLSHTRQDSDHSSITRCLLWPLGFPLLALFLFYILPISELINILVWINDFNYLLYANNLRFLSLILTSLLTSLILF